MAKGSKRKQLEQFDADIRSVSDLFQIDYVSARDLLEDAFIPIWIMKVYYGYS